MGHHHIHRHHNESGRVAHVGIEINGFPERDKDIKPLAGFWAKRLTQQGVFPGNNRVVGAATSNKGDDTVAISDWSRPLCQECSAGASFGYLSKETSASLEG